jgi:hypothetical protein
MTHILFTIQPELLFEILFYVGDLRELISMKNSYLKRTIQNILQHFIETNDPYLFVIFGFHISLLNIHYTDKIRMSINIMKILNQLFIDNTLKMNVIRMFYEKYDKSCFLLHFDLSRMKNKLDFRITCEEQGYSNPLQYRDYLFVHKSIPNNILCEVDIIRENGKIIRLNVYGFARSYNINQYSDCLVFPVVKFIRKLKL